MKTPLDIILEAAQTKTPSFSIGALDAFRDLIFGQDTSCYCYNGTSIVLQTTENDMVCYITPSFTKIQEFIGVALPSVSLDFLCAQKYISFEEQKNKEEARKAFHSFGVGMHFVLIKEFLNTEAFINVIEKYNCHRKIGEVIASDLTQHGFRTTTVQAHLIDQWSDMATDLKKLGVLISRKPPHLKEQNPSITLEEKVSMLQKQFKKT